MKNKIKTMAVIMLMISFIITSCKKDEAVSTGQDKNIELSNNSQKVLSLIQQFEQKMNSTLKAGDKIHIDSVVWNSEALQNYNYAIPDTSTRDFIVYKANYTLSVNANNMAYLTDVQTLNSQMETDIQNQLESIDSEETYMRFCDIILDSIESETAYITALNGFGYNLISGYYGFEDDDDWIWGTLGEDLGTPPSGKCDGTQQGVSDGSNELNWRLNNPLFNSPSQSGTGWTNVQTVYKIHSDFTYANGQARIYVDPTATASNCLYDSDLEFYLEEADDIIYSYDPDGARPTGKDFMNIHIIDEMISGSVTNYLHVYAITYGMPYTNPN